MFLSKRSNGIYYLWFTEGSGRRRKVSCRTSVKSIATNFVRSFVQDDNPNPAEPQAVTLLQFAAEYDAHIKSRYTLKTREVAYFAFRQFSRVVANPPLREVSVRQVERFLNLKLEEASAWTARKYYGALASAFETAIRWGYLHDNPFRKIKKPAVADIPPLFGDSFPGVPWLRAQSFE